MTAPARRLLLVTLISVIAVPSLSHATTIDPLVFEELVIGGDFVGIVECTQAGGIVAKYKVVESWKGPKAGETISIRVAVNYWEPQFGIALCGERYFITAFKTSPTRVVSTTSGGGVPLWWRNIPSDYRLPLFQGRQLLSPEDEASPEFKDTRKRVRELTQASPAQQEALLLKAIISNDLFGETWRGGERNEEKAKKLHDSLSKLESAQSIVESLLGLVKDDSSKWSLRVKIVLTKAGHAVTLDRLTKLRSEESKWSKQEIDRLITEIRERRGVEQVKTPPREEPAAAEAPPTAEELVTLRAILKADGNGREFSDAFEKLTRHDPETVAAFLVKQKDIDYGYEMGSYFAWQCGKDRRENLQTLLKAADPHIRVAGGVYLCFEDKDTGTAALKELMSLEGDPGVWAALTLARRGHKEAVPRMLEVFRVGPKDDEFGVNKSPHRNLQKRVRVLLSNSAQAPGIEQPVLPDERDEHLTALHAWWKKHGDKVALRDPWMPMLEKQKVD